MIDIIAIDLPKEVTDQIDIWIAKFPTNYKQAAVIPALTIVQKYNNGWLSKNLLEKVADYLDMPKIKVYEIANFYNIFELKPIGKYKISVCTNLSCMLCGCKNIVEYVKNKLNINVEETTKDLKFSLRSLDCVAACDNGPVIMVNNKCFNNVTIDLVDEILSGLT